MDHPQVSMGKGHLYHNFMLNLTPNPTRQSELKQRTENSGQPQRYPDIREQRRRNKVNKLLKTVNFDTSYNTFQHDIQGSYEHPLNLTNVSHDKKYSFSQAKISTNESKEKSRITGTPLKADIRDSFELPEHDQPSIGRSSISKFEQSEFQSFPKEICQAIVISSHKTSSIYEQPSNNLRDSSNLIRDSKATRESFVSAKSGVIEHSVENENPYKSQKTKSDNKRDYLAQLRARYVPDHSGSLGNLGSKQQMLLLSKVGLENDMKAIIDSAQNYQSNPTKKTTDTSNKPNGFLEDAESIYKKLDPSNHQRHPSPQRKLKHDQIRSTQQNSTKTQGLTTLSEAHISRLRPRTNITESKRESKTLLISCFATIKDLETAYECNKRGNKEEIEPVFDKSVAQKLADLSLKQIKRKSVCSPSGNDYPPHFANLIKKFKNQNIKAANFDPRRLLVQPNSENWIDASFDQDCSNISKIDQLYSGLCLDSVRQNAQKKLFS